MLRLPRRTRKLANPELIGMSEHKYRIGQAVEFFPERGVEHTAKGRFKIVRLLLDERDAPCYRIKHEVDGHERMVGEGELGPR
jgi:hypothetical protein